MTHVSLLIFWQDDLSISTCGALKSPTIVLLLISLFFSINELLCCSVAQSCPTLCDPLDCRTPSFPVLHRLLELAQTHVHWISDAIQPSHPLLPPSPPALSLSQHQGLFQFKSTNSSVLSLYPALTSVHDYWKSHSFDYRDLCWQSDDSAF